MKAAAGALATLAIASLGACAGVAATEIEGSAAYRERMACPPPLDALERSLGQALAASSQWRIEGDRLELLDEAGVQMLLCEAVDLD